MKLTVFPNDACSDLRLLPARRLVVVEISLDVLWQWPLEGGVAVAGGLHGVDLLQDVDHADQAGGRVLGVGLHNQAEGSFLRR